ncbi:MAG TPA: 1-deoxy-D-xylulose-5-phosphate reductoisomerase [Jatrophihabitantaceae bacterium]|nr:1-deoxy-D-xylulose-5-phosphate reductoisomerase [Jatrophihabitantaceae bacterium]
MTSTEPRRVTLLGSTGSVGTQAIEIVVANPQRFRIASICAGGSDLALLARQAAQLRVDAVGVSREDAAAELTARLVDHWPDGAPLPEVLVGAAAAEELAARDADVVLNAVAGAQGLRATIAALTAGRTVALANKESLVAGGGLVTSLAAPGQLVPVDSEHSALAQCLRSGSAAEVRRLLLTASGGPFRGRKRAELADVTPQQALAHPTWDMGRLVTTNSATLVNKGLEMIEAHLLFDVPYDRIDVVVHPQSIVHSMVEFVDGSTLAQASPPDMRLPIALALDWPDRVPGAAAAVDWSGAQTWTFEPLDGDAFPAVELARLAGTAAGCAPAVYNAANEELVEAFHSGLIGFVQIVDTVRDVLDDWLRNHSGSAANPGTVEEIEDAQAWARARARELTARD